MPEIIELAPQPAVVVTCRVQLSELGARLGSLLPPLLKQVREAGGKPAGNPFTRFLNFAGGDGLEIQAGIPVLEPVECRPPAESITLPGGETATLAHHGPYERLPSTHADFDLWFESSGRFPAGPRWEVYVTDPATEPDPSRWLTRLFQPLLPR